MTAVSYWVLSDCVFTVAGKLVILVRCEGIVCEGKFLFFIAKMSNSNMGFYS